MTIVDALADPRLLGGLPAFRGGLNTWRSWLVVWKAVFGLSLDNAEVETFKRFTGRSSYAPPQGGWSTIVLCVGRRSGKTFCASILAAFSALSAGPSARGQAIAVVAQDFRSGQRNLFRAVSEPFESVPAIAKTVARRTADTIALRNGLNIVVLPCKPAALRGMSCRLVAIDEIAFSSTPDGLPVDRELIIAARPTLATVGGSKLVILSSPASASGALYDLVTEHHGRDDSPVLCIQAPAYDLNPQLPESYLAEMRGDPESYASEVEGQFRSGAAALFDPAALSACVVAGRVEIEPSACTGPVRCFVDPAAGGRGGDRFTAAVGYRSGPRVVVAALRAFASPFSPSGVVAEIVALCRRYRATVTGDRFGGELVRELFTSHGLRYATASQTASDLYQDMLSTVSSGGIELPDPGLSDTAADLIAELRSLERCPGGAGRDRVEAPRGAGRVGHADLANAVAGLVSVLPAKRERRPIPFTQDAIIHERHHGGFIVPSWMDEAA